MPCGISTSKKINYLGQTVVNIEFVSKHVPNYMGIEGNVKSKLVTILNLFRHSKTFHILGFSKKYCIYKQLSSVPNISTPCALNCHPTNLLQGNRG